MTIEHDNEEFLNFLDIMYDKCPNLYIIITSGRGLDFLPGGMHLKPQFLSALRKIDSAELFW